MDTGLEQILSIANSIQEKEDDSEVIADLSGFQVTKAELFSHTREPAVTIWENRIKFNMACLRRLPGVTHIQVLIHPEQKRLIIRPCNADAPDSLRWARGGGDKELANRDLLCKINGTRSGIRSSSACRSRPRRFREKSRDNKEIDAETSSA